MFVGFFGEPSSLETLADIAVSVVKDKNITLIRGALFQGLVEVENKNQLMISVWQLVKILFIYLFVAYELFHVSLPTTSDARNKNDTWQK